MHVDTQGTGRLPDSLIAELVRKHFRLNPVGHHQAPRPAAADLPQDGQRRPLRPLGARVHLGEDRQGPRPARSGQCHSHRRRSPEHRRGRAVVSVRSWHESPERSALEVVSRIAAADATREPALRPPIARTDPHARPVAKPCWRRPERRSPPGSAANRPSMGCAPGRVELLGNHTDYNGGLVMAAAIDRLDGRRRPSGRRPRGAGSSRSTSTRPTPSRSTRSSEPRPGAWTRYVRGVCWALTEWCGPLASGFEAVDRRRRPARGGPVELGEPSGVGRLVPDPARPACPADRSRDFTRRHRRPAPHGAGQDAPAVGK